MWWGQWEPGKKNIDGGDTFPYEFQKIFLIKNEKFEKKMKNLYKVGLPPPQDSITNSVCSINGS